MKKINIIIILFIVVLSTCKKENKFDYALIQTGEVTNIDSTGATFHAKILDPGNENITEYGFVWDADSNPVIQNSEKYILEGQPAAGLISQRISTTLHWKQIYFVRAFIRNNDYITYGKNVVFKSSGSIAPQILNFYPKTGNTKDTLVIIGKNFSYIKSDNKVSIGDYHAIIKKPFPTTILKAVQDTIIVTVPELLNSKTSVIMVSVIGNKTYSTDSFNLIVPVIDDFEPKTGGFSTHVTITGKNFLSNRNTLHVYFNDVEAEITDVTDNSISAVVPDNLNIRDCFVYVEMNNIRVSSKDKFSLAPVVLTDFSPKTAVTGETITLTGDNFSPIPANNSINIGGLKAEVSNASKNELKVIIPTQDKGIYPDRNVHIKVKVFDDSISYNETLLINDKWFRLKDFPGDKLWGNISCVFQNKVYIFCNNSDEMWVYDIQSKEYTKLSKFPGHIRYGGTGFRIGSKLYFGAGVDLNTYENLTDFWEYDLLQDKWIQKSNLPGDGINGAFGFSNQTLGYIGAGIHSEMFSCCDGRDDVWSYSPVNDKWTEVVKFPIDFGYWCAPSAANYNFAYVGIGRSGTQGDYDERLYSYNFSLGEWKRLSNFPVTGWDTQDALMFIIHEKLYCKSNLSENFWIYDIPSDKWSELEFPYNFDFAAGIGISDNEKGYFGLGRNNTLWEFDPLR